MIRKILWMLLALTGLPIAVDAAQPYFTDDASILEKGACQFEVGRQANQGNNEAWLLPACNFTGNLELTLGQSRRRESGNDRNLYVLQAKGLFAGNDGKPDAWGWVAGMLGRLRDSDTEKQIGDVYASLLYTREVIRNRMSVNVNVGTLSDRNEQRNSTTWGLSTDIRLAERVSAIAETFGNDRAHAFHQVGLRFSLVPDFIDLDISRGAENGSRSDTRWWTMGLRFTKTGLF